MYNIMDYGAMGDGAANDAPAIQKAVDECSQAGGGVVYFREEEFTDPAVSC